MAFLANHQTSAQSTGMKTLSKPARARRPLQRSKPAAKFKFPVGHPFAGIEDAFGSVSIPVPPSGPKRRALLRARILADHNT